MPWCWLKGFFETGEAKVAVIDKTKIKIGESWLWLWVAIEPDRRKILAMALTGSRNSSISPQGIERKI